MDHRPAEESAPAAAATPVRPTLRFLLAHPAHALALGWGSGLPRLAPGTWGTVFAWLAFNLIDRWLSPSGWVVLIGALLVLGAAAAQRTGRALGAADSGHIVIDEIVAFWIVLLLLPGGRDAPMQQALAFVLFRGFDILKPPPIRALDRRLKNGIGVMADDLVAAFYALFVFALLWRLLGLG